MCHAVSQSRHVVNEDYTRVLAVPCDMFIAGYGTKHTNALRVRLSR